MEQPSLNKTICIPETPEDIRELQLLRRLEQYASGDSTYTENPLTKKEKHEAQLLHTRIANLLEGAIAPILDRTTSRELETFTMHNSVHAHKVANLMWYILLPDVRAKLTPPEIGIMISAAFLHDLGMALSPAEREARLAPESDLWTKCEFIGEQLFETLVDFKKQLSDSTISSQEQLIISHRIAQAEEALLALDTRERHSQPERLNEIIEWLNDAHLRDPNRIPSPYEAFSFGGDSFLKPLLDVCASHCEDAVVLIERGSEFVDSQRFTKRLPVGTSHINLLIVAAALRLADILDFDRERTPYILYHYLLPTDISPQDDPSVFEWNKHLAISNWRIETNRVVYAGRCKSHIVHHGILNFLDVIERELSDTRDAFDAINISWPFILPINVEAEIHSEGYRYVPYKFTLDDERIYSLLMGGALYPNPIIAVRELLQNAVDACKLRAVLTELHDPGSKLKNSGLIEVRYIDEVVESPAQLIVRDSGVGMDQTIIEKYFLKVGQSYWDSSEFQKIRTKLRVSNLDFSPVSDFGIGFLSVFLLASRVKVETAMWETLRGDTRKRTLIIDGPTRLMKLEESPNNGLDRFRGTCVTLYLSNTSSSNQIPSWDDVRQFIVEVCRNLPYSIDLVHVSASELETETHHASTPSARVPYELEDVAIRIPVDGTFGLTGELALVNPFIARKREVEAFSTVGARVVDDTEPQFRYRSPTNFDDQTSSLIRGGFRIGSIPGLPTCYPSNLIMGELEVLWDREQSKRYPRTNLSRTGLIEYGQVANNVQRIWLEYLIKNRHGLPVGQIDNISIALPGLSNALWLEEYSALALYELARQGWIGRLGHGQHSDGESRLKKWESGRGPSLMIGMFNDLYIELLMIILPFITKFQLGEEARIFVCPPASDWRDELGGNHSFLSQQKNDMFIEYIDSIADLLLYRYAGNSAYFNSKYRQRLESLESSQLIHLMTGLDSLIESRDYKRVASLSSLQLEMIGWAKAEIGELLIGTLHEEWPISTILIPNNK